MYLHPDVGSRAVTISCNVGTSSPPGLVPTDKLDSAGAVAGTGFFQLRLILQSSLPHA